MKQVRTYARWIQVPPSPPRDGAALAAASKLAQRDLVRWCKENLLVLDAGSVRVQVGHKLDETRVVLAEGEAAGTDPATRYPKGWRGLLRAP